MLKFNISVLVGLGMYVLTAIGVGVYTWMDMEDRAQVEWNKIKAQLIQNDLTNNK